MTRLTTLVAGTILVVTLTSHTRAQREGEQPMAASDGKPEHEAVLLEDVLADWERLTGDLKEHQAVVGEVVYVQPCVYLSTHLVEMWAAGWKDMDFDTLAAVSGCSALFGYQPKTFMPKYAHVWIDMHERVAQATGFGYEWVSVDGADRAWEVVKESIDAGKPVKGWHYENLLFGGYEEAAEKSGRKVFVMADGPDTLAEWWTWEQFGQWVKEGDGAPGDAGPGGVESHPSGESPPGIPGGPVRPGGHPGIRRRLCRCRDIRGLERLPPDQSPMDDPELNRRLPGESRGGRAVPQ